MVFAEGLAERAGDRGVIVLSGKYCTSPVPSYWTTDAFAVDRELSLLQPHLLICFRSFCTVESELA